MQINVDILKSEKAASSTTKKEDLQPPELKTARFVQREYIISARGLLFFCAEWSNSLKSAENKKT